MPRDNRPQPRTGPPPHPAPGTDAYATPHPGRTDSTALDAEACRAAPPRLSFLTRPLPAQVSTGLDLLPLLAGHDDVVSWVHQGQGLIGLGRALTITASGAERIEALRAAWRQVVYSSWWRDPLVRPGTGPVALGTIAFSPASASDSVLIVPRLLVGLDDQGAWLTTVVPEGEAHPGLEEALAELGTDQPAAAPSQPPALGAAQPGRPPALPQPGSLSPQQWCAAVQAAQQRMSQGQAHKVVLARDVVVPQPPTMSTGDLLARLGSAYPTCWTFAVDGMVGASPEMLVRLEGRRLFSRVLAGTARLGRDLPRDQREAAVAGLSAWLGASAKNTREHALARASVLEALEPLCSTVEAHAPRVLELPNVLHLASDVRGVVAGDTGALSLVGALHPTAAVGGTPTAAATRIIEEVEGMDRGRYAGPVGWVDWHGEGQWCIALRSAQLGAAPTEPIRVFGGCGIMPDSDPLDELAETEAKMRPVLEALACLP